MRLSILLLSAVLALAMTEVGFAQATLPNDAVNNANNPGSVKDNAPVRADAPVMDQALNCTCRTRPADAATPAKPEDNASTANQRIDCSCHKIVQDRQEPCTATAPR